MSIALYKTEPEHPSRIKAGAEGGNAGLFWGKFFNGYNPSFTDFADKESSKRTFIQTFEGSRGETTAILDNALRQIALTEALGGVWFVASNHDATPFVTGTGNHHPVENGFLWHHTLSTPYMQGSAVKGVLRSWLENDLGYGASDSSDIEQDRKDLVRYFGSDNKDPKAQKLAQQAGNLIFFDAVPIKPAQVKMEIMTPHLGDYYAKGRTQAGTPDTTPADWHSPNPIPLLAVKDIALLFCIAPRPNAGTGSVNSNELKDIQTALKNALENSGAGAKTATGFGRLMWDEEEQKKLNTKYQEAQKAAEKANASEEDQVILTALEVINNSASTTLLAGQPNYSKFSAEVKKTESWSEEYLIKFWVQAVQPWLTKAFSDKKKQKEQAKKLIEKYTWLKKPQE